MPLTIGQTFAGYTIIRLLGSGGMGEVYLVQHPRLPRRNALKVLPADVSADAEYRARFVREADLASTLYHPHIVGVHDRGEHEGKLWISMDYVDGADAARLLADRFPAGMPPDQVARILTATASALDYAHKQGMLHRDVKPANVMLTQLDEHDEQRILLTDFGIARGVDDISGLTTTNMAVGTVAYSAPEQLMGEHIDGRADQYSLAATAYHLLTGSQLYPHSNPAVVISRHLNSPAPRLADSRPELAHCDPILEVALAKDPNDRFARCLQFASAFAEQAHVEGSPSPLATTRSASLPPTSKPGVAKPPAADLPPQSARSHSRRRWLITAAALAVILLSALAVLTWHPWERERSTATGATSPSPKEPPQSATRPLPPPAPPLFPAKSVDRILLTADQLSAVLGVDVYDDPSLGGNTLALDSSSYGAGDNAAQVTPQSCVGVVFTGEHDVYKATNVEAIKTQTFGNVYGSASGRGPYLLRQTAVVLPSAEQAQAVFKASQAQWTDCSNSEVDATFGYENGRIYEMGSVQTATNLITITMADNNPLTKRDACQQALAMRDNVVVESRTCNSSPEVADDANAGFPKDPDWAVPDAERIAQKMLENVAP